MASYLDQEKDKLDSVINAFGQQEKELIQAQARTKKLEERLAEVQARHRNTQKKKTSLEQTVGRLQSRDARVSSELRQRETTLAQAKSAQRAAEEQLRTSTEALKDMKSKSRKTVLTMLNQQAKSLASSLMGQSDEQAPGTEAGSKQAAHGPIELRKTAFGLASGDNAMGMLLNGYSSVPGIPKGSPAAAGLHCPESEGSVRVSKEAVMNTVDLYRLSTAMRELRRAQKEVFAGSGGSAKEGQAWGDANPVSLVARHGTLVAIAAELLSSLRMNSVVYGDAEGDCICHFLGDNNSPAEVSTGTSVEDTSYTYISKSDSRAAADESSQFDDYELCMGHGFALPLLRECLSMEEGIPGWCLSTDADLSPAHRQRIVSSMEKWHEANEDLPKYGLQWQAECLRQLRVEREPECDEQSGAQGSSSRSVPASATEDRASRAEPDAKRSRNIASGARAGASSDPMLQCKLPLSLPAAAAGDARLLDARRQVLESLKGCFKEADSSSPRGGIARRIWVAAASCAKGDEAGTTSASSGAGST